MMDKRWYCIVLAVIIFGIAAEYWVIWWGFNKEREPEYKVKWVEGSPWFGQQMDKYTKRWMIKYEFGLRSDGVVIWREKKND